MAPARVLLSETLDRVWTSCRGGLGRLLGQERLGRLLDSLGLRGLKARTFLFERSLPDGNVILYRSRDQCVIEEIYAQGAYTRGGQIRPGAVVVDAGGHIGTFTLLAARLVGPTGRVVVCEPSPESAALLRSNVARNGLKQVTLHECALAEAAGRAQLFVAQNDADNPVADTLAPSAGRAPVEVALRTLDEIFAEDGLDRIDLLKIDVEGAELRVLAGGTKALAATRRVIMEVHPGRLDPQAVLERLQSLGFRPKTLSDRPMIVEADRP